MKGDQDQQVEPAVSRENLSPPALSKPPGLHFLFLNEAGPRAGWRILCWLVLAYAFINLIRFGLYPMQAALSSDIRSVIAPIEILLGMFAATAAMARLERRSFWFYGLRYAQWGKRFCFGALVGWLSLTLMLAGMRVAHAFYFGQPYMHGRALLVSAVLDALSFLFAVALFEEVMFRSYLLYTLADGVGFWPAAVVMSLIFALAHVHNPGEARLGIVAVFAFGMMLAFSLWRTGSLLWAIGFHFMWDYSETFLYGVPDSGFISPEHLLSANIVGPAWITGGSVGPEGSWFIFFVLAAIALTIHLAFPCRQFEIDHLRLQWKRESQTE
jgi:membrane protease YdiL (CAAX protease family)